MAKPTLNAAPLRHASLAWIKPRDAEADDLAARLASDAVMARGSDASAFRFALRSDADPGAFGLLDILTGDAESPAAILAEHATVDASRYEVLGSVVSPDARPISLITTIPLTAAPGQSGALEALMARGPESVAATEPNTLQWYSLRDREKPGAYVILDLYADRQGLAEHLVGEVAATLKANAPQLVTGGWKAVVSKAINSNVIAQRSHARGAM